MKRILRPLAVIAASVCIASTLPSCRSHKEVAGLQEQPKGSGRHARPKGGKRAAADPLDSKTRRKIVEEALKWKGTPYAYARAERGVATDCSGLVMTVYEKVAGIKLPRNSAQQRDFCNPVRSRDVKMGDLVFFATGKDPDKVSHVGIMVDDVNFVHASASKGVVVSNATASYYQRTFKGFGRVPD